MTSLNAPETEKDERALNLRDLFEIARRHLWLVLLITGLFFIGTLAYIATLSPAYRATATVLLDQDDENGGLLGELAKLGSAPAAVSEIAVLSSRSVAAETARSPLAAAALVRWDRAELEGALSGEDAYQGTENAVAIDGFPRQLDLETRVENLERYPLWEIVAKFQGRTAGRSQMLARTLRQAPNAPDIVKLTFLDDRTVRVAEVSKKPHLTFMEKNPEVCELGPDKRLEYRGLELQLAFDDDLTDQMFLVEKEGLEAAIGRVKAGTRVVETQRKSGVLALTYSDTNPVRAAAVANAMCRNYFDLRVAKGRRRAEKTIAFIDTQLEEQNAKLEDAHQKVVSLQEKYPDLIDARTTAQTLIQHVSEIDLQRMRVRLSEQAVADALELIEAGRFDSLSRLGADLGDPLSVGLIEQLTAFDTQRMAVNRVDGNGYRLALQEQILTLENNSAELALQIQSLHDILRGFRDGDVHAHSMLVEGASVGVVADPTTLAYLNNLASLEASESQLAQEYTDEWVELITVRGALAEARERLAAHLASRLRGLREIHASRLNDLADARERLSVLPGQEREVIEDWILQTQDKALRHLRERREGLGGQLAEIDGVIDGIEGRLSALPERERELAGPMRALATHREITTFLTKSLQEAKISAASSVAAAEFIDPATIPSLRSAPRLGFGLGVGTLLGLFAGLALAFLREQMRGALHSDRDLEAATGLPVLATVPDFRRGRHKVSKAKKGFLAMRDDPHGPVAESYRSMRANLRFCLGDLSSMKTFAITSCAPSEGKSTTNVNMAWAFASGGRRVLLVDADMRLPSVHRYLEIEPGPGLAEVLRGEGQWHDLYVSTQNPNLFVLRAGRLRGSAGDVLTQANTSGLIDELAVAFDMVVFDLPPALVVADVETFSHRLDALVLLYHAGGQPRDTVASCVSRLRLAGARLAGTVMNAYRPERVVHGGYYGDSSYYTDAQNLEEGEDPQLEQPRSA